MTTNEKKDDKNDSFFAKPAEVEVKDVDDRNVTWGQDAADIADEAGLGSYGPDANGMPPLGDEVAEQAVAAMHEQLAMRSELRILRAVVYVLVLSEVVQYLWLTGL